MRQDQERIKGEGLRILTFGREGMRMLRSLVGAAVVPMLALVPMLWMSPLTAQQDSIPGVTLGLLYEAEFQPALAVQPFLGRLGGESMASRVEAIIARDLRYSDRFEVMDSLPASLVADEIDYQLWDQLEPYGWCQAPWRGWFGVRSGAGTPRCGLWRNP